MITGRHRTGLGQRLGLYGKEQIHHTDKTTIWIHGASVGEIGVAELLLGKITESFPAVNLVVTTATEQGLKMARKNMGNKATCLIAPLDLPGAVTRAVRAIRPNIYLCIETELWPNTIASLRESGATCFLLNARLSEKSFHRYRHLQGFTRQVLEGFSGISAISDADAERLVALGANPEKVTVSGNLKYDLPPVPEPDKIRRDWQQLLGLTTDTPVLVAGSTHSGEETLLLNVFADLKRDLPELVFLLAPRHLSRLGGIQSELATAGVDYDLLSKVKLSGRDKDMVLIDSMGDLASLYSVATFAFCGGSLVERGGHNVMEAARWGHPVFFGPSMKDFADARDLLEAAGGGFQVDNATELRDKIKRLAEDGTQYQRASAGAARGAAGQNGSGERQLRPVFAAIRKLTNHNKFQSATSPTSQRQTGN